MSKKINSSRLRYLILKELYSGEQIMAEDVKLSNDELDDFILNMQKDGLVDGYLYTYDGLISDDARVTLTGEEYMRKNSDFAKIYNKAKEVRDWIPFVK